MTEQPDARALAGLSLKVKRLESEIVDMEHSLELHASLNRRAAEALGKPATGTGSSWHDIPEQISALRAALSSAEARAQEARREAFEEAGRDIASLEQIRKAFVPYALHKDIDAARQQVDDMLKAKRARAGVQGAPDA